MNSFYNRPGPVLQDNGPRSTIERARSTVERDRSTIERGRSTVERARFIVNRTVLALHTRSVGKERHRAPVLHRCCRECYIGHTRSVYSTVGLWRGATGALDLSGDGSVKICFQRRPRYWEPGRRVAHRQAEIIIILIIIIMITIIVIITTITTIIIIFIIISACRCATRRPGSQYLGLR